MPKLKKQKRRKVYRHNVNRKRLRNKLFSVGEIGCKEVKKAYDQTKSVRRNMEDMGLAYDPNTTIKMVNTKAKLKASVLSNKNMEWSEEKLEDKIQPIKAHVVEELERDAKAPRERLFRLPNGQVELLTYYLEKYGDDYKAMARDKKNYYQETWKQIRAKIKRFRSIPEQYSKYLRDRGLTEEPLNEALSGDDSG